MFGFQPEDWSSIPNYQLKYMQEEFKDVVGYEDLFSISNTGKVYSKRTNRILKTLFSKIGYEIFTTKIGGRKGINKCFKVHRLVAEAFLPNFENKRCVNHKDGIKTNNHISNLEWASYSENNKHAYTTGLKVALKGENNANAVLTEQDVKFIKTLREVEGIGKRKISTCLNLPLHAVSNVLRGNTWKHVNTPEIVQLTLQS